MDDILYYSFNEKSSVLLIFFFNALLFSSLLFKKGISENKKNSKWLAAFVFLGGLYICPFMFGYAGWYGEKSYREFLFFFPFQQLFLLGPVFFFYVKTLLNNQLKWERLDIVHFLPAIFYMIYTLVVFVTDKLVLDEFYFYANGRDKDLDFWYQMTGLISMLFYLFLSLRHYLNYRKLSVQEVSFADEIAFKWIQHFAVAFSLILLLRVLFFILNPEWGQFGSKYWYYLCFSISGYTHAIKTAASLTASPLAGFELLENDENTSGKIEAEQALDLREWKDKIALLFDQEDLYKNPNLTLTDLASALNTNRNMVSKAINQEYQMNFNDFVNKKRAEAVIQKLKNREHVQNTLLGLALDCGFNSKTTFNRAFKKHTGITPKQYIDKNAL